MAAGPTAPPAGRGLAGANGEAASVLARCLVAGGVRHVVASPGSRSTPLVLAFAEAPGARVHVVLDERVAAFVALGLARVTGPVALVATSGTAGAHWLPAAIEARHSRLPLVLLTADRPPELHGCGAPQTVPQGRLFGDACVLSMDLGAPGLDVDPRWLRTVAARAVDAAVGSGGGPVHLNVPFREPLWEPDGRRGQGGWRGQWGDGEDPARAGDGALPPARILRPRPVAPPEAVAEVAARLSGRRGVIVAGPRASRGGLPDEALARAVERLAAALGWPVVAEPLSQLRFGHGWALPTLATRAGAPVPDVVLRLGQAPTSKQVGAFFQGAETILVDPHGDWLDPAHGATLLVVGEPAPLCEALVARVTPCDAGWLADWRQAAERARTHAAALCDRFWEGAVARAVAAALPDGAALHVASSLAVRDLDAFAETGRRVAVTSNRGANGIDGTLATAAGQSLAWMGPVVALVGDLAFFHDHGALHAARALGARLVVVVVDNGGGGIFETLPVAAHPTAFERLFLTPQPGDLGALAAGAGARVARVTDAAALEGALTAALESDGVTVVHAVVDRTVGRTLRGMPVEGGAAGGSP